jgi:hypothetical protein
MKTFLASLSALLFAGTAFAQTDSTSAPRSCATRTVNWLQRHDDNFELSLGFNALAGKSAPELRPGGSRFVSLGFVNRYRLVNGTQAGLVLRTGAEVSWYNFMLEGNRIAVDGSTGVDFVDTPQPLRKSKLTAAYLSIPLTAEVVFRRGMIDHLGAGGYAGYRIAGYSKVRPNDGTIVRDHGSFGLENFRYGLSAELGIRHFADFFVQYDLNPLFRSGRGPAVNGLSFGIRL